MGTPCPGGCPQWVRQKQQTIGEKGVEVVGGARAGEGWVEVTAATPVRQRKTRRKKAKSGTQRCCVRVTLSLPLSLNT